ncbi:MAG: hypothetical protein KAI16_03025, partial [Candidatus Pacebacteria bacterium]|nr:hypothetical protein [Candidatus Paceibacterota bacterium]
MNLNKIKTEEGWILKWIIIIFGVILVLSFLGFNLRAFMESDSTTGNLGYVMEILSEIWVNYFKPIYDYIAEIIGPIMQDSIDFWKEFRDG